MTSAYISRDSVSLESGLHSLLATGSHSLPVDDYTLVEAENPSGPPQTAGQEELPRKKVETSDLQFIYTYIYICIPLFFFLTVSYCRKG